MVPEKERNRMPNSEKTLLAAQEIDRALSRMAYEIAERNMGCREMAFIGIRTGGVPIARRLATRVADIEGETPPVGILDITLYRDDWSRLSQYPIIRSTEIPFSIDGRRIILVDDVLYTGRTIRAALDAITDFGRPAMIQLAVLVDRGRREFPIQPDFTALSLNTSAEEHVNVFLEEIDGRDMAVLGKKQ